MTAENFKRLANTKDCSHSVRMALLDAAILHEQFDGILKDVESLQARISELEAENERLKRWENNRTEMLASRKASCVEKCGHPAEFVCDYEDGTRHCLECVASKIWEDGAENEGLRKSLAEAVENIRETGAEDMNDVREARRLIEGLSDGGGCCPEGYACLQCRSSNFLARTAHYDQPEGRGDDVP